MRRLIPMALAAFLLVPAFAPTSVDAAPTSPVRIAVIDTGIDATHPEFAPGQIVAWRDFVNGQTTPYDDNGHGTATASLVAGLNVGRCAAGANGDKLSFAPGSPLVIAKVLDASGSASLNTVDAAIRWALTQNVGVISISIGASIPVPLGDSAAIRDARAAGVLVVVSAGNGAGNLGLAPYPATMSSFGNDRNALVVGAGFRSGSTVGSTTGNLDPEVASWGDNTCIAVAGGTYRAASGTSLSAPLVAGMAAKAMEIARDNGKPSDANRIERLLVTSATNSPQSPYAREGMGFLLDKEWPTVAAHAAAGTLPNYDAQGPWAQADRIYHDNVVATMRNVL